MLDYGLIIKGLTEVFLPREYQMSGDFLSLSQESSENSALDKKVSAFLERHRTDWRGWNVSESDGKVLYDIIVKKGTNDTWSSSGISVSYKKKNRTRMKADHADYCGLRDFLFKIDAETSSV